MRDNLPVFPHPAVSIADLASEASSLLLFPPSRREESDTCFAQAKSALPMSRDEERTDGSFLIDAKVKKVLAHPFSLAATWGIEVSLSSCCYLDVSVHSVPSYYPIDSGNGNRV